MSERVHGSWRMGASDRANDADRSNTAALAPASASVRAHIRAKRVLESASVRSSVCTHDAAVVGPGFAEDRVGAGRQHRFINTLEFIEMLIE